MNVNGVSPPITQLQKIAGFSCAAQRRYRIGEPQNLCGMPDILCFAVVGEEGMGCLRGDEGAGVGLLVVACSRDVCDP